MTAPDEPCSDATRRRLFTVLREAGVEDHHNLLPWCGITSISRAGGVTESQVRMLTSWVEAGCLRSVHRHLAHDQHRVVTYLDNGDVEFATLTEHEYAMATAPRPPGRLRGPLIGPVVTPAPTPASSVVTPPRPTGRPVVGRVRLGVPAPTPAPEPEPVVEVAPEAVVVAAPELPDLSSLGYVRPCVRPDVEWLPPTRGVASRMVAGRRMPARPGLDLGPEPHGPPCPVALHAIGDLSAWGGRGFHA